MNSTIYKEVLTEYTGALILLANELCKHLKSARSNYNRALNTQTEWACFVACELNSSVLSKHNEKK